MTYTFVPKVNDFSPAFYDLTQKCRISEGHNFSDFEDELGREAVLPSIPEAFGKWRRYLPLPPPPVDPFQFGAYGWLDSPFPFLALGPGNLSVILF